MKINASASRCGLYGITRWGFLVSVLCGAAGAVFGIALFHYIWVQASEVSNRDLATSENVPSVVELYSYDGKLIKHWDAKSRIYKSATGVFFREKSGRQVSLRDGIIIAE